MRASEEGEVRSSPYRGVRQLHLAALACFLLIAVLFFPLATRAPVVLVLLAFVMSLLSFVAWIELREAVERDPELSPEARRRCYRAVTFVGVLGAVLIWVEKEMAGAARSASGGAGTRVGVDLAPSETPDAGFADEEEDGSRESGASRPGRPG